MNINRYHYSIKTRLDSLESFLFLARILYFFHALLVKQIHCESITIVRYRLHRNEEMEFAVSLSLFFFARKSSMNE